MYLWAGFCADVPMDSRKEGDDLLNTAEHGWVYTDLGGLRGLNCSSWLIGWGCILGGLDGPRACLIYGWAGLDWVGAWVTSNKIDMIAIDVYVLTR